MKRLNDFIEKVGIDKVLHFICGALIVELSAMCGVLYADFEGCFIGSLIGLLVVYLLSIVKEKLLDDYYDQLDIDYAMMGSISAVMFNFTAMVCVILIRLFV